MLINWDPHTHRLAQDTAILFLGMCPRKRKLYVHTKTYSQMLIAALFIKAKNGNEVSIT